MADELNPQEAGGNTYLAEVERALSADEKRLGKVWRLSREGLNPNEIAEKSGYSKAYVNHCTRMIKALVDSTLPNTTTLMARRYGPILRDFVKRHQEEYLSDATVAEIGKRADEWADECARRANDPVKREEEEQKFERQTSAAEQEEVPGIYVYALPHYLRYPVETSENDETDDRTYLKVGMSERDAIKRFRQQRGSTALPEPPILLRIYVGSNGMDIAEVERKIHRHLAHADHVRNSERGAGTEWFLTHLKFLDSTAELLDLKTHFAIDDSDDDQNALI
ncbi:MAG: GIY-YIG nuclease family protein [Gemmatimonadota bacterium]|nr:GIY-YIG nuclease family protein [Gemmatimonadota bacterium]